MTIVLTYTKVDGSQEQVEFEDDVTEINLREKGIKDINLDPLADCSTLKELVLSENQLKTIDLSPIGSCTTLEKLDLEKNRLKAVDLRFISTCANMRELVLGMNELHKIDLTPLKSYANIKILNLSVNPVSRINLLPLSSCENLMTLRCGSLGLTRINLSPLSKCSKLSVLRLGKNAIDEISLTPLGECKELKELSLRILGLQSIDLHPLSCCTSLERLDLSENQLETIDLAPLSSCTNLRSLNLLNNQLQSIDLTPLSACSELAGLYLYFNKLKKVDITPISLSKNIDVKSIRMLEAEKTVIETILDEDLKYPLISRLVDTQCIRLNVPIKYQSLDGIRFVLPLVKETSWKRIYLLQEALLLIGLGWVGFLDTNNNKTLEIILNYEGSNIKECILPMLVPIICKQIDDGGTTIGLDIEKAMLESPELAKRVSRILMLRKKELSNLRLGITRRSNIDFVDLRPLWLTAYGNELLRSLKMPLEVAPDLHYYQKVSMEKIEATFAELGFKLKIGKTSNSNVRMSDNLKLVIWATSIAERN